MPAARCSNCGRFMNATAGCSNPRCNTSSFSYDVFRSSSPPPRCSTRRSRRSSPSYSYDVFRSPSPPSQRSERARYRSPTYSYEVSYSSEVPVEAPRRKATTPNCRTCGRFMNATIGCRNPRCLPIPRCTITDASRVTVVKMKPEVSTDRSGITMSSSNNEQKITNKSSNNKLPPSNILTGNVVNSVPKSSGVTGKPEAVSNIKLEPGVSINRSVPSVSSLKSEQMIIEKRFNDKLSPSNSLTDNVENLTPKSSGVAVKPKSVSHGKSGLELFFETPVYKQKIIEKSSNDKLSPSSTLTDNDGNFSPKSSSVTTKPECISNVKPEPGFFFKPLTSEQKIVNKNFNDKLSSSNSLTDNVETLTLKSSGVAVKPKSVSHVKSELELFFKPLFNEKKIIDKSSTGKFLSSVSMGNKVEDLNTKSANAMTCISESVSNVKLKPAVSTDRSMLMREQSLFINEQKIINNSFNNELSSLNGLVDKFGNFTSKFSRALNKLKSVSNERHCELIIAKNELQLLVVKIATAHKDLAKENARLANQIAELEDHGKTLVKYFSAKQAALEVKFDELLSIFDKKLSIEVSATESSHTLAYGKYSLLEAMCIQQQDTLVQMLSDQKKLTEENIWLLDEQAEMRRKLTEMEEALAVQRSEIQERNRGEASLPDASPHYNVYKVVAIAFVTNCVCFPLFRFISRRISKQILQ